MRIKAKVMNTRITLTPIKQIQFGEIHYSGTFLSSHHSGQKMYTSTQMFIKICVTETIYIFMDHLTSFTSVIPREY